MSTRSVITAAFTLFIYATGLAQADKQGMIAYLEKEKNTYSAIAKQIWEFAEVGYQEQKSSALLQEQLRKSGFAVTGGVAGIPTAFSATYGSGRPVIAILAEFDALPGLSQQAIPEQKALVASGAGHGCGHNLFGAGSTAAGIAVKEWLARSRTAGTIRVYGTPAEEGGSGKVYMVREGLFKDVDVVLHWHPGDKNVANASSSLANKSGKFRFHGIAAHAAAAPDRGRSALDGVEAMNNMVNMMREHVPSDTRIHYVITKGGEAPNVVPAFAEVYYYVRHHNMNTVKEIWNRVVKAAEGAAMGCGVTVDHEVTGGVYNLLANETLSKLMYKNLQSVGGVTYSEEEKVFAGKIQSTLMAQKPPIESVKIVEPFKVEEIREGGSGSTDVGDVSWAVPTVGMRAATFVPGTPNHSWQAVAAGGTDIGSKGMMVAAKALALTAYDIYKDPLITVEANKELVRKRGDNFKYEALVGDRKPALDYRQMP